MRYRLVGTELEQAVTDVGYTYVVRQGRAELVDTTRLDKQLKTNRQPWDLAELEVVRRNGVMVIVNRGQRAKGEALATATAQAASVVKSMWPEPLQVVPVVIAVDRPGVLTDLSPTVPGNEAIRVEPMHSPAENGRAVGGWVVMEPTAGEPAAGEPGAAAVGVPAMVHGLMHLVPLKMGDEAPRLLMEGLAQYAVNLTKSRAAVARQRAAIGRPLEGRITRLPAEDEFTTTNSHQTSWLAVDLLIRAVGVKPSRGSICRSRDAGTASSPGHA